MSEQNSLPESDRFRFTSSLRPHLVRLYRRHLAIGLLHAILIVASPGWSQSPTHVWSQRFGGATYEGMGGVGVDASGSVTVTGFFAGTANFGGAPLVSAGSDDIFVARYDASGAHQWSRSFGDTLPDWGQAIAVDPSGNVIVTGYFRGSVDFGGGDLVSAGAADIFVVKYDASGVHQWSQRFGGVGGAAGYAVGVDPSGNVVMTGAFEGTVDFGGGSLVSVGPSDIFVAKYDASGVHQWSQQYGDSSFMLSRDLAVNASGDVMVTGNFQGAVDFGGGPLASAGSFDIFVAKYDANGVHQWSQRFGGAGADAGSAVVADASGNVMVTGTFRETVDFGGGSLVSAGSSDIFVAKYDASGAHQWSQRFGDSLWQRSTALAVNAWGEVMVTGSFEGTVDFGGGNLVSAGLEDAFVAKYDASGVHAWSQRFGGTSSEVGGGVGADPSGNVTLAGSFRGTVDFGGGPLTSAGEGDIFVTKYADLNVAVAIGSFDARAIEGGVALHSSFASNLQVLGVNVYRAADSGRLHLYEYVPHSGEAFYYEDRDIVPGHEYRYQIGVVDDDGEFLSQIATVRVQNYITALLPNSPNPFNPTTRIRFTLAQTVQVNFAIYDARGAHVTTLIDGIRSAGPHQAQWDGTDAAGSSVSSGVYFYRMRAGSVSLSRRMVLLK